MNWQHLRSNEAKSGLLTKNNFPGLSSAGLGFLWMFVDYILLFIVTQLNLLKCYVYILVIEL